MKQYFYLPTNQQQLEKKTASQTVIGWRLDTFEEAKFIGM
jgi:hypothetical protein